MRERRVENSRVYHSESESSESDSTGNENLSSLLKTRGLTAPRRFSFKAGDGSGNSSTDEEGVKGKAALCESGLDGSEEVIKGGDSHGDLEGSDGVGRSGGGKSSDL